MDTNEGEIVEESKLESEGEKHIIVAGSEEGMLVLVDSKDRSVIFKMITHIEKSGKRSN